MQTIEINAEADIVAARSAGRGMSRQLGFGSANQTRLATAISELARNVVRYAGTGVCTIDDESDENNITLKVVVEDHGPGIADIDQAMKDGYSTGKSLGAGLPGTKRLVQAMNVKSEPGHTRIEIRMIQPRI